MRDGTFQLIQVKPQGVLGFTGLLKGKLQQYFLVERCRVQNQTYTARNPLQEYFIFADIATVEKHSLQLSPKIMTIF